MGGDSSLFIHHDWRGSSLFQSSSLPYLNFSNSSANSEWILRDNCPIHIQAWYGDAGWVSNVVLLSIHSLIHITEAKFIGIYFLHNFNITRPHFYHSVWKILTIFNDFKMVLQLLQELKVSEDGELDPTWVGPVHCPWVVNPSKIRWDLSLEDALRVYKNQVWSVCSLQCLDSPEPCYSEPIIKASLPETIPSNQDSSCSWGNDMIAPRCTDSTQFNQVGTDWWSQPGRAITLDLVGYSLVKLSW